MVKTYVIKRDGKRQKFNFEKIKEAVNKAFVHTNELAKKHNFYPEKEATQELWDDILNRVNELPKKTVSVEEIQDIVEDCLMDNKYHKVSKAYILYRDQHKHTRFIKDRIDYMDNYSASDENGAGASETDANANVNTKNVNTLEPEVFKVENRMIQRCRMSDQLSIEYPDTDLDDQYEKDIEGHEIYINDEASSPAIKPYCQADSIYPLMLNGIGAIDGGKTEGAPHNISSFSGQLVNFIHAASGACKGAVAIGEYFVGLNYYVIMEFGPQWYDHLDEVYTNTLILKQKTIRDKIEGAFKQFVYGINQPAGNRGGQSPFTNISYFDHTYFNAMFESFIYPDGTAPEWKAIDTLQRMFMKWFNNRRLKTILTFPVETMAMVYDPESKKIVDEDYRQLTAEMYSEGHSFFTYISDSADSLASCCRLRNKVDKNTFSPTSGLTGIKTGSCNVITLNIARIIQNAMISLGHKKGVRMEEGWIEEEKAYFIEYMKGILDRVYKYHIAFKHLLYREEERHMYHVCNGGYINMKNLYSTIGINGLNEAARYIGLEINWNEPYVEFLQLILSTIKEENEKHSIHDKKHPILFNSEVIPAENVSIKHYGWDKEDGYWVPEDKNLYNSYFYDAHDPNISILDKMRLHGHSTYQYTDGGSAAHINLNDHLTKEQYLKVIDFACQEGCQYFTFNIPNGQCVNCKKIFKHPFEVCPDCGGEVELYTRVIGFLVKVKNFSPGRFYESKFRVYSNTKCNGELD